MNTNFIKLIAIAIVALPMIGISVFKAGPVRATAVLPQDDVAAAYKKDCALCHKPTGEKFFDPAKSDEVLIEVILKGKKVEKPPHMPGFEAKGMKPEQAKSLVEYMRKLRAAPAE